MSQKTHSEPPQRPRNSHSHLFTTPSLLFPRLVRLRLLSTLPLQVTLPSYNPTTHQDLLEITPSKINPHPLRRCYQRLFSNISPSEPSHLRWLKIQVARREWILSLSRKNQRMGMPGEDFLNRNRTTLPVRRRSMEVKTQEPTFCRKYD